MTKELRNQIEGMVEHYLDEYIDAYQCQDWGINAQEFANHLIEEFEKRIYSWAYALDNPEDEEE